MKNLATPLGFEIELTKHARLPLQQRKNVLVQEEGAKAEEKPQREVDKCMGIPDA